MSVGPNNPRRFLPSDPRVEEPYRLTPQLALRVAVLGGVAHLLQDPADLDSRDHREL